MNPHGQPDFPLIWNDSLRTAFVACPRAAFWESFHHFKGRAPNAHLHAGKAWAAALERARLAYYGDYADPLAAQALGLETLITEYGDFTPPAYGSAANKSLDRMIEAFTYYFTAFPLSTDPVQPFLAPDKKPMVEFNFALPIDAENLLHPVTNEPILFAGRADMIATFAGALSVYDDKTTSQLGPTWAQQWNRRSQFSAYCWAAQQYGIPITQVVVRGIAILKTSINHAQAIVVRTPHHIAEWHAQVIRDIKRAIECYREDYFDVNLSDSCSSYGGCMFQQPCMSNNPMPWLESTFVRRAYDPITRTETPVIPITPIETLEIPS
jgi:hypothetical protein